MGAGLATQHGWDHIPSEPDSPGDTDPVSADAVGSNPRHDLSRYMMTGENQPLEDGEGWGNYHSTGRMESLVPVQSFQGVNPEHKQVLEDNDVLRDERVSSIAYDLGAISTEDEVSLVERIGNVAANISPLRGRTLFVGKHVSAPERALRSVQRFLMHADCTRMYLWKT